MGVVRILIAAGEAGKQIISPVRQRLQGTGWRDGRSSGKEAVALAETRHPDLVLMDTRLRGDGGSPAAVKNLQTRCNVPVVLVATSDEDVPPCGETPQSRMGFWSGRLAPGSSGRWSKRRSTGIPESRVSAGPAVVKRRTPTRRCERSPTMSTTRSVQRSRTSSFPAGRVPIKIAC